MRLIEKFRPKVLDDVVGQPDIIQKIKNLLKNPDDFPHLMFVGPPGTGKTSIANCLAKELLKDEFTSNFREINASNERGIEVVRGQIKEFAKLMGRHILYLGESDEMTPEAQNALRRTMETTKTTIFILSGNHEHKYIDAIQSRCAIFRFKKINDKAILKRLIEICKLEQIEVDFSSPEIREGFKQLVADSTGDMRKALNNLQKLIDENKKITVASVVGLRETTMLKTAIMTAIAGDFEKAKQIVEDEYISKNFNSEIIFNDMYHALEEIKDREVRIRCYEKLGELERNVRLGTNPLIQFVAFTAFCWLVPHLPKKFPEVR